VFEKEEGDALMAVNWCDFRAHGWLAVWTWNGTWDGKSPFAHFVPSRKNPNDLVVERIASIRDQAAIGKTHF
jgi:hypothetical protein